MSYLRYIMGADIRPMDKQIADIPRQPPKKPRNPTTPNQKPIPREKVKAEVSND